VKILEALRYKISFFSVHQLVRYISDLVRQKYGIEIEISEVLSTLKDFFSTDLYFRANLVSLCLHAVFKVSRNFILKENFYKIFEKVGISGDEIKNSLSQVEQLISEIRIPENTEIESALKRFDELSKIVSMIRTGGVHNQSNQT
jgi:hypothetical protein